MAFTGLNLIGNTPSGNGTNKFQAINPVNGEQLDGNFIEATRDEVSQAVEKAEAAFPGYRSKLPEERAQFLEAIAEEVMALGDELIQRCMAETALPEGRFKGERGRTVNQLKLFAEVVREGWWADARIDTAMPNRKPLPRADIRQMHIPIGPVGIFGASNFPLAFSVAGGDTASALAAGCPVVVKAHPMHPGVSELVGQAIIAAVKKTNMPDGTFSMVQGPSVAVGMAIVTHPKITAIGFTGSFRGGKAIFDAAQQRPVPIPVFAEMGSSNPVFILPGAMKEKKEQISKGFTGALNLGVGQFCTNPGLVITDDSEDSTEFLDLLVEEVGQSNPGTMLGPGIKKNYLKGVERLQEAKGVILKGSSQTTNGDNDAQSNVFCTDAHTFITNKDLGEEVFGPSTLNITTNSKKQMLQLAHELEGHLTATIHGTEKELEEYADLIRILERKVGRIIFNGYPTGVEVCDAMVHGGPFPATTAPQTTSVGTAAIKRFARPVCYQDFPQSALPPMLKDKNPFDIWRLVNGEWTREPVTNR